MCHNALPSYWQGEYMKPEPGVHPDVPMSEYGAWDAANYSTLKHFRRSAAHAREALVNPPEQTAAMLLGQATHSAILEPFSFTAEYAVAPKVDRRKTKDKKIWADFLEDNKDKDVLTAQEFAQCSEMAKMAHLNTTIASVLGEAGINELSFAWVDKGTDILCKGRCDRFGYVYGNSVIADLKTTENASEEAWKREVVKYQYHAQAAFYLDGLDTLEPVAKREFIWIAIEKKPPYACAVYQPDAATLQKGRAMYRNYLRQYGICREAGMWPGYATGIQPLLLPDWALRWEDGEDEF
jgi:hypothetical protein